MQKPPKLLEAQNVNKNKCLKNIFQKIFKPISWKENLFKKKKKLEKLETDVKCDIFDYFVMFEIAQKEMKNMYMCEWS